MRTQPWSEVRKELQALCRKYKIRAVARATGLEKSSIQRWASGKTRRPYRNHEQRIRALCARARAIEQSHLGHEPRAP